MTDADSAGRNMPDVEAARELHRCMVRIRTLEDRIKAGKAAGEIFGSVHLSIGQEAVPAGVCANLDVDDLITSNHRGHGHCIAKGASSTAIMSELFGRATGSCGGKGGSMHMADFSVGMLGANGVVAAGIPIAVGAAQGLKYRGSDHVVVPFFGDGAVNRGPFLEGLNWAKVFHLPVMFVCEDNGFAATTRRELTTGGEGAAARAAAIGIPAETVDGNDALAVYELAKTLLGRVRAGEGPMFLHAKTTRFEGHMTADSDDYRDDAEKAAMHAKDPIARLRGQLADWGVSADALDAVDIEAAAEMTAAVEAARIAPWPDPADALADSQDIGAPV